MPPPLLPAPTPRTERGVDAVLAPPAVRVERGVPDLRPGLCKKDEGLMPAADRVDRGLRPRVDCGSSPKNPPTMSSRAPNVGSGVCSIGELAENIDGVNPVPLDSSRSKLPITAEFGTRFDAPPAPPRLRADDDPGPLALSGCALADLLGALSSPKCFGARPEPRLPGVLRLVTSMADKPCARADERVVDGGPSSKSFIQGDCNDIGPGLTPTPSWNPQPSKQQSNRVSAPLHAQ